MRDLGSRVLRSQGDIVTNVPFELRTGIVNITMDTGIK
jgi:hypothetical protein